MATAAPSFGIASTPEQDTEAQTPPKKPDTAVYARNWSKLDQMYSFIQNPDETGVCEYRRMFRTDETVSAGIEFIILTVISRLGQFEHPKARCQKLVRDTLKKLQGGWPKALRQILLALPYGFSATEKIWTRRDGQWVYHKLISLDQKGVVIRLDLNGGLTHGDVSEVIQNYASGTETQAIHKRYRVIHYAHREEAQQPYGNSRLKACWKDWFLKDALLQTYGQTLQRYAGPIAIGKTSDMGSMLLDDETKTRAQYMLEALAKLRGGGAVIIKPGEDIDFTELTTSVGKDFQQAINYLNRMIFRALMLPELIWEGGDTGSLSLGTQHWDVFLRSIEEILNELEEILIQDFVKPLLAYNFGEQEDWGCFKRLPLEPADLEVLTRCFYSMTNSGYMTPAVQSDLNFVRDKIGLGQQDAKAMVEAAKERQDSLAPPDPALEYDAPDETAPGVKKNGERGKGGAPSQNRPSSKVPGRNEGGANKPGAKPMDPGKKVGWWNWIRDQFSREAA